MENLIIGMIGMGMIGNSTAVLTTMHGYKTICYARNKDRIPCYEEDFDRMYREMVTQGIMTEEQHRICRTYLHFVTEYEGLAECTFLFEAITEDVEAKRNCFAEIERCCPNVKAIGSCSSSISADVLAASAGRYGDRILVTHPFYPVHMVPYFELSVSAGTAEGVLEYTKEVLKALDRKPSVLKKPNPGFIGNYLQFALWAAALKLVEDGVCDPEDVDNCLNYSFCPRYTGIGMFEHFDNGGYRLNRSTCDNVFPALPRYEEAPALVRDKAESPDAWGARSPSKRGFYDWNGVDMTEYRKRVNAPYWRFMNWKLPEEECE